MKPLRSTLLALLLIVPPAVVAVAGRVSRYPARFAEVMPGKLYRGGFPSTRHIRILKEEKGIRTIISLTDEKDEPKYVEEKRAADELGIRLLRFAMPGDGCAQFGDLDRAVDALADALADAPASRSRPPVFYHCAAGKQRSNALLGAYRMRVCRWPFEQALQELERDYGLDRQDPRERALAEHLRAYAKWLEASGLGAEKPVAPGRPPATAPSS